MKLQVLFVYFSQDRNYAFGQSSPAGMHISGMGHPLLSNNPGQRLSPGAHIIGQCDGHSIPSFPKNQNRIFCCQICKIQRYPWVLWKEYKSQALDIRSYPCLPSSAFPQAHSLLGKIQDTDCRPFLKWISLCIVTL